jgi:hypothetical protein
MNLKERIDAALDEFGVPAKDMYTLPDSESRFPDGCHYRMEISGIDSVPELEALVKEREKRGVPIHRTICMGNGTNILTNKELVDLAQLGTEAKLELVVVPGPRAIFDIGKHADTEWGKYSGIRLRGSDNISYFIDEILRCLDVGIRGFLFYGEDMVYLLNHLRGRGLIPADTVFKISYTAGHANAAGAKLVQELGADSLNPVTDLTLPMLASLRSAVDIPLDIVVVTFHILGKFNRFWETPEIVRTCAPCYLKQELASSIEGAREKVKYCEILTEIIAQKNPTLKLSPQAPSDLMIPLSKSSKGWKCD